MRIYLIDSDQNEEIIDIIKSSKRFDGIVEAQALVKGELHKLFFKKLAGKFFYSTDEVRWNKTICSEQDEKYFDGETIHSLYKGFKPSGLFSGNAGNLITQMPGKIVKISVKVGDSVQKGDTLIILEAMKMENEIKSSLDGEIKEIHVKPGQAVESGFLMMEIE